MESLRGESAWRVCVVGGCGWGAAVGELLLGSKGRMMREEGETRRSEEGEGGRSEEAGGRGRRREEEGGRREEGGG